MGKHILVIADIEGSSDCLTRASAKFLGRGWPRACRGMSLDVRALVGAMIRTGAQGVHVQDFHRTGYNIFPALMPRQVSLSQGYSPGPVPGLGSPGPADALMMIGMHAPSGSGGFLAHTLTSRIAAVRVNGEFISEAQLFSAALAPLGIPPLFFSGCPVACAHVRATMPGVRCFPIDKSAPDFNAETWRSGLAEAAVHALSSEPPAPYNPQGPFSVTVTLAGGSPAARAIARAWGYPSSGADIHLEVRDFNDLFSVLSRMIFLTPLTRRLLPLILPLYGLMGKIGLTWAKIKAPV